MYAGKATEALDGSGQHKATGFPLDDFVVSLVALGHQKTAARKLVEAHQSAYDGNDENFITLLLQQGT